MDVLEGSREMNETVRVVCNGTVGELLTSVVQEWVVGEASWNVTGSWTESEWISHPCWSCNCTNTTRPEPTLETPLNINGGFIAMAAGLSVVVPLICVLIIQLRRAKREERERREREASGGEGGSGETSDNVHDPPPSYEQLFGPGYEHESGPVTFHSRHNSTEVLLEQDSASSASGRTFHDIEEEEDGLRTGGGAGDARRVPPAGATSEVGSGGDGEDGGEGGGTEDTQLQDGRELSSERQGRVNRAFSTTSVATISGSEVADLPAASSEVNSPPDLEVNQSSQEVPLGVINLNRQTSSSTNNSHSNPSTSSSEQQTLTSPETSPSHPQQQTTTATRITTPSESTSGDDQTPSSSNSPPPPPSHPPPPFSDSPPPSPPPPPQPSTSRRRFPGMHISIQEFFSSLWGSTDSDADPPPPTYEEALKILEKAKLDQEQEHK